MKKEHILIIVVGLFILSYVLDAVVDPLALNLPTPYHYLTAINLSTYPFTTASIIIRALGIFLTPLLLFSFFEGNFTAKGAVSLVLVGLMQLYALQDIATGASVVPLEWALSISIAGLLLLIPMIIYFMLGALSKVHKSFGGRQETNSEEEEKEE